MTVSETLQKWEDYGDFIVHAARQLGLLANGDDEYLRCKWVFMVRNSLGHALFKLTEELVRHGALIRDENADIGEFELRWNESFDLAKCPDFTKRDERGFPLCES